MADGPVFGGCVPRGLQCSLPDLHYSMRGFREVADGVDRNIMWSMPPGLPVRDVGSMLTLRMTMLNGGPHDKPNRRVRKVMQRRLVDLAIAIPMTYYWW